MLSQTNVCPAQHFNIIDPMPHSYEELRSAAFDVLSGRTPTRFEPSQYQHLKIGVARALEERGLQEARSHLPYPGDNALDSADANIFMELFWDLFRQGIISLGMNDANPEFPWFHVTSLGRHILAGENPYFIHDVSGFEARLRREIPKIDEVTLLYLKEALQDFRSGCVLSATVMLGVATEHTFLLLIEVIERNAEHADKFASVGKERTLLSKANRFRQTLDRNQGVLPREVKEDLDTNFAGILSIIRNFRNDSGHPSGKIIDREQAYVLLELFPAYARKMYQLMDFFS
jgi:hypothetical protein